MIEFEKTIRGKNVTVYTYDFHDGNLFTIKINIKPYVIYAKTHDGQDFELTEQEIEELSSEATDIYCCGLDY